MNISNNTILITGGSSGVGLALAKEFLKHNNVVIICGRSAQRLEQARLLNPKLRTIECDVSDDLSTLKMVNTILKDYPQLNMIVNNAGLMHLHDVAKNTLALGFQKNEIMTNIYGTISLCDRFIPHLQKQKQAAIINVTSGLAYMPFVASPVYAATKAAIHSYSLSIRSALNNTSVSVFEVLPPMVDTEMTHGMDMPGMKKIKPEKLAEIIVSKIKNDQEEVRPGAAAVMINMYRLFPWAINKMMSSMAPKILENIPNYK